MNRVGKLIAGLILIAGGAGGLVYLNTQLLPEALSSQPAAASAAAAPTAAAAATETATATRADSVPAPSAPAPSASAASSSPPAAQGPSAPIAFEIAQIAAKNMSKIVEPLATFLKKNPTEKVVLVGHGDPKTRTRDYMEVGRARALTVRRTLLEWGVAAARVQVQPAEMEGDQVKGSDQFASMVEVRLVKGDK
jgi:outer membrane protein OmpA-like peptidoglycan-associated protein